MKTQAMMNGENKMIHLTIDGKQIEVAEGTTVLRAAQQAGLHIPTLCDHPHLTPYGGCRLCLVDVKGARTLQPSCTMPATEGMEVTTQNEKIAEKDLELYTITDDEEEIVEIIKSAPIKFS